MSMATPTESVKRVFQSKLHRATASSRRGVLADFLEVDTRYESVVEEFSARRGTR